MAHHYLRRFAAIAVGLLILAAAVIAAWPHFFNDPIGPTTVSTHNSQYGLPAWLPRGTASDAVLVGSQSKPAITEDGEWVQAQLPGGGSVLITINGPQVPGEGLAYEAPDTTCTWTVTMKQATREVTISPKDFAGFDQSHGIYHVSYIKGVPEPPSVLKPGQSLTFDLRASIQTGEGVIQWAPDGKLPVATWDFVVEDD